ncbi:MAG TPA: hypothetical protein DDX39_10905 [Bacteroidales bacterium]|nr:MAG: hypothetical protein A2W98_11145 [Bacteroidetes bacterium GWF2_33_38]OFY76600.1 MAG: hypothetical protein A2265_01825 [Bacteroidetes bacterium RIFOXYA12_FULL_33_9]OFY89252.1 MAG: hypothetical protein A2236_07940 [Bacteroidetes bacterium RIFOXYA2_FULL_33_7]HBF89141.1 hypothetical protein [Bacteroidales bacterium]
MNKYSEKLAIKVAKLLDMNPPDLTNFEVDIIVKVIDEAMHEQRMADIREVNSIERDENGMVYADQVIEKINENKI